MVKRAISFLRATKMLTWLVRVRGEVDFSTFFLSSMKDIAVEIMVFNSHKKPVAGRGLPGL